MTLRCGRATEADVDDLGPGRTPRGMASYVWARSRPYGRQEYKGLAWYRGQHGAQIEAVKLLQRWGYVRIAARMQKHYGLNNDGSKG